MKKIFPVKSACHYRANAGSDRSGPLSDQSFFRKNGICHCKDGDAQGAEVTLVSGPTAIAPPLFVKVVPVTTARDMFEAVTIRSDQQDIIIKAAAVADYRPKQVSDNKVKKKMIRFP